MIVPIQLLVIIIGVLEDWGMVNVVDVDEVVADEDCAVDEDTTMITDLNPIISVSSRN